MKQSFYLRSTALLSAGALALFALDGCNKSAGTAQNAAAPDQAGGAPVDNAAYGQAGVQSDSGQAAPATDSASSPSGYSSPGYSGPGYSGSGGYERQDARYAVPTPPPELPTYEQPPSPGDGYLWTPGYWAWSDADEDYYWTPGTWVQPPQPDDYWTPGYWRYTGDGYGFVPGYWGPTVGFYGGVDYGYGYNGDGYYGGQWRDRRFYYNSEVNNGRFANSYSQPVVNHLDSRESYNGGPRGVRALPTPQQQQAARGPHIAPTAQQVQHFQMARTQPDLRASVNHGRPPVVATSRPTQFKGPGVVTQVRSAPHYTPPPRPAPGVSRQAPAAMAAAHPGPQGSAPMNARATIQPQPRTASPMPARQAVPSRAETRAMPTPHAAAPVRAADQAPRAMQHAPAPHAAERVAPPPRPIEHSAPPARAVQHAPPPRPVEHAAPAPRPQERAAPPPRAAPARPAPASAANERKREPGHP